MIRRALGVGALALLVMASAAVAAAPAGPRLALIKLSPKPPGLQLLTVGPKGGRAQRLAGGGRRARPIPEFFSPVSWSPDGEKVAFSGILGFRDGDDHEPIRRIFLVHADGSGLRAIPRTNGATGPVFSPDGRTIAFTRRIERETPTKIGGKLRRRGFNGSSVWTVDFVSGAQRQLTPWREGLEYVASSFSPDGSTLLAEYDDDMFIDEPQPVALKLDGSGSKVLFDDGSSPVYSPDGSKIAMVRRIEDYSDEGHEDLDLFVGHADGTGLRRITRTPGRSELYPTWDPSGERLAYVRFSAAATEAAAFGLGDALMQVNADGTCQSKIVSSRRMALYAPAWQPGPGREAGRIEC
ncbi:MAG TPA: hypothetical protein VFU04_01995 [Solirubrobacterales bacterium]|nr:hypothetical protein [Solirubrobacterales bacterium]